MQHIVICGESSPDQMADIVFSWLKDGGLCPGYYKSGRTYFGTGEPELDNQTLLQAHDIFIRHSDLDSCLWSMTYAELEEFGLPDDKIDLVIDLGKAENKPLKTLLQNNTQIYHHALVADHEQLVIPTPIPGDDLLPALVNSFKN